MPELSQEKMEELTRAFKFCDKNGDGHIESKELGTVLRAMGQNPTEAEIREVIKKLDSNDNGTIEFVEFKNFCEESGPKSCDQEEDELRAAFQVFDRDKSGYITREELRSAVTSLGERLTDEEADELIRIADTNGDGQVNYMEFVKVVCSKEGKVD